RKRVSMQIFLYRNGAAKVEEGFAKEDLPKLLEDRTNVVWVDICGDSENSISEARDVLLNVFKFHPLTVEDCIEERNQPKVEPLPDHLYFIVHGIRAGETKSENFVTKELDGYLGPNYVVTFHVE